jgi:hypothetical protein
MHPFHMLLAIFAALSLVGLGLLMRWERKAFLARGMGRSWLVVRLSTIPIALITAALVIIPARSTAGMEGLAVFYLLLIAAAPFFWFGAHWVVGRLLTPKMPFGESARIAGSPLAFLLADAMVAHSLQTPAWILLRAMGMG